MHPSALGRCQQDGIACTALAARTVKRTPKGDPLLCVTITRVGPLLPSGRLAYSSACPLSCGHTVCSTLCSLDSFFSQQLGSKEKHANLQSRSPCSSRRCWQCHVRASFDTRPFECPPCEPHSTSLEISSASLQQMLDRQDEFGMSSSHDCRVKVGPALGSARNQTDAASVGCRGSNLACYCWRRRGFDDGARQSSLFARRNAVARVARAGAP